MSMYVSMSDLPGQPTKPASPAAPTAASSATKLPSLAALKVPPPPAGGWQGQAQALETYVSSSDWVGLARATGALADTASASMAMPVATAAKDVQAKAVGASAGTATPDDVSSAMDELVSAAESEDTTSDGDRNFSGELIAQQISQLESDIAAKNAKLAGYYAVWEKIRGIDTSDIDAEAAEIQQTIDTTPLSVVGRRQLTALLKRAKASLITGPDWETVLLTVGGALGVVALTWAAGKAQALAAKHAKKHISRTRWGQKFGIKGEEEEDDED